MEEKSYFEKLLTKYGIRRIDFCKAYGIHTNNFNRLSNLQNIKVLDLKRIHDITKIPYNLLVGETMFTPQNIDTQQVTDNLAFNDRELAALKSLINKELQKDALV